MFGDAAEHERGLLSRCIEVLESSLSSNDERTYDTLLPLYGRLDVLRGQEEVKRKANEQPASQHDCVTHEHVRAAGPTGVDYDRLVRDFGSNLLDPSDLARIEAESGEPLHLFLRRGLYFSHRDLGSLLDAHARGESFYIFTGRGPSASMHLGHLVPFQFAAYLQRAFAAPVVIQISDDEKFFFKGLSLADAAAYAADNIIDIIACGFDPQRTFIFSDTQAIASLYPMVMQIQRKLTCGQLSKAFGVKVCSACAPEGDEATDCVGKLMYPAVQMAPAFASGLPPELFGAGGGAGQKGRKLATKAPRCLVPMGIDQDPYFRVVRDAAKGLGQPKPAVIHNKFLPALAGLHTKMSASAGEAIRLTDTPKQVRKKMRSAFSGARGDGSLSDHRRLGADLETDVAIKYLQYFLPDDAELAATEAAYAAGTLTSGEVKDKAAAAVSDVLARHQQARALVTAGDVALFTTVRPLI